MEKSAKKAASGHNEFAGADSLPISALTADSMLPPLVPSSR